MRGVTMKISAQQLGGLATTALLAACTPQGQIQSDQHQPAPFTDAQKKNLLAEIRPNIFVAQPALFARALNIAPLKEKLIPLCEAVSPAPVAQRVVKIRIDYPFSVKNTGRNVVSKRPNGNGVRPVPEPVIIPQESTTYDLKLDKTVWDATDNYIAIKVILKDERLIFPSDNAAVTTVGDPGDPSMFYCMDRIKWIEDKKNSDPDDESDTGKWKYESTTVYVDKNKIMKQKFNIRVIALHNDDVHALPLIMDPVVDNNGFN